MDMQKAISIVLAVIVVLGLALYLFGFVRAPQSSNSALLPEGWTRSAPTLEGMTYAYPTVFDGEYFSPAEWPPRVEVVPAYVCVSPGNERPIDGQTYCVTMSAEGAAGSSFLTYDYLTNRGDAVLRASFTIRFPQCLNYDEPNQTACKAEQATVDPDTLATTIIASVEVR